VLEGAPPLRRRHVVELAGWWPRPSGVTGEVRAGGARRARAVAGGARRGRDALLDARAQGAQGRGGRGERDRAPRGGGKATLP